MNITETSAVVAKIQLGDNRRVDDQIVREWHATVGHNDYGDAMNAVVEFRKTEVMYLMPAHINRLCKVAREERADAEAHAALIAPDRGKNPPKPRNEKAMAAAWNDRVAYEREEDIYNEQLREAGWPPVFDTFLALPPIGQGR